MINNSYFQGLREYIRTAEFLELRKLKRRLLRELSECESDASAMFAANEGFAVIKTEWDIIYSCYADLLTACVMRMIELAQREMVKIEDGKKEDHFPAELTEEMLKGFVTTKRGCTHPRTGMIKGRMFIAKCGSWSAFSSDGHVDNELVADAFLRAAGLNVPESRKYRLQFTGNTANQTVRLADFHVHARPLMEVWQKGADYRRMLIRQYVIEAYPIIWFIAGIDTFTFDNVRVDQDGKLWFVDNGSSFDYRACGKKKDWFWERRDLSDAKTGYMSLLKNPDQGVLREILATTSEAELWAARKQYDFVALVKTLPPNYQRQSLIDLAKQLQEH